MKTSSGIGLIAAITLLLIASTLGEEKSCDCTIFPFKPDPPCASTCIAKYLAIASLDDLKNIFGLPDDIAKKIASIPPDRRPRRLEDYKDIIPETAWKVLGQRIDSLRSEDFKQLRLSAEIRGMSVD